MSEQMLKMIEGLIMDDDVSQSPVRECQHCGADLTIVGVEGFNSVDFKAMPDDDDLSYEDSWYTEFEEEIDGAIIRCSSCHETIQMAGCYGRLWFYQNLAGQAVGVLDTLIRSGLITGTLLAEMKRIAYDQDIFDRKPAFIPIDRDMNRYGSFPDQRSAAEYAANNGLDTVIETEVSWDHEYTEGNEKE